MTTSPAPNGRDQLADFGTQPRMSQGGAGAPAPEQAPAPAVPAKHGLRPNQQQMASPALVQAPDEEPEEFIPSSEAWTTLRAKGDLELLAEEQVLDDEALMAADSSDEGGQKEPEEFEHRGRIADPRSRRDRRMVFCPPIAGRRIHLPHSLQYIARRRLALVGEACRRTLGAAAVIGRDFELGLVAAAAQAPPSHVAGQLAPGSFGRRASRVLLRYARLHWLHAGDAAGAPDYVGPADTAHGDNPLVRLRAAPHRHRVHLTNTP